MPLTATLFAFMKKKKNMHMVKILMLIYIENVYYMYCDAIFFSTFKTNFRDTRYLYDTTHTSTIQNVKSK